MRTYERKLRNRAIIDLRLNSNATLSSIGKQFGMTKQAIHCIVRRDERLLQEYLEDMERIETSAGLAIER